MRLGGGCERSMLTDCWADAAGGGRAKDEGGMLGGGMEVLMCGGGMLRLASRLGGGCEVGGNCCLSMPAGSTGWAEGGGTEKFMGSDATCEAGAICWLTEEKEVGIGGGTDVS